MLNTLFCSLFMKKGQNIFSMFSQISAVCMILALLWLTISTPFVFRAQQKFAKVSQIESNSSVPAEDTESSNPLGNTTEEKAPSNSSLSEEYLHNCTGHFHLISEELKHFSAAHADTYLAYHGELDAPPPDYI